MSAERRKGLISGDFQGYLGWWEVGEVQTEKIRGYTGYTPFYFPRKNQTRQMIGSARLTQRLEFKLSRSLSSFVFGMEFLTNE